MGIHLIDVVIRTDLKSGCQGAAFESMAGSVDQREQKLVCHDDPHSKQYTQRRSRIGFYLRWEGEK